MGPKARPQTHLSVLVPISEVTGVERLLPGDMERPGWRQVEGSTATPLQTYTRQGVAWEPSLPGLKARASIWPPRHGLPKTQVL